MTEERAPYLPEITFGPECQDVQHDLRIISVFGVDMPLSSMIRDAGLKMAVEDPATPITLIISSLGGNAFESLAVADSLNLIREYLNPGVPIIGIASGYCMSAGMTVLQACDMRWAHKTAQIMLHGPNMKPSENCGVKDLEAELQLARNMNEAILSIYKVRRGRQRQLREILLSTSQVILTAQEALEWGLIEEILT